MIEKILAHNEQFVKDEKYKLFETSKYPDKKIAILSCMDTRLTELLPAALGIKNGDAKIIKNAGAVISHPFGSVMRSLMVCIYVLGVTEILVIGHKDCGMQNLDVKNITNKMIEMGIDQKDIDIVKREVDLDEWLCGFDCVEDSINQTVYTIKNHPLISKKINVYGLIIDPVTGKLDIIN